MNTLLEHKDEDLDDRHHSRAGRKPDREITLGTTLVLGIFFALAVFGAVMFGFGYSIGAKHTAAEAAVEANPNATFNSFLKPNPGKTAADLANATKTPAVTSVTVPLVTPPPLPKAPLVKPAADPVFAQDTPMAEEPTRPSPPVAAARPVAAAPLAVAPFAAGPSAAGQMMVQIAAVSHQEDADLLVSTLKRRSYAVAIHREPQDQLLHVQVGPFASRKDADVMRLRLQADGFNAIVKGPAN